MIRKSILSLAMGLLITAPLLAQQPKLVEKVEAAPGELKIPYEKYTLDNGLTVILQEDHSDPIVHVEVTYHVGSARESLGKSGFAHFFEHMMFQGSEHVEDEEHFKLVQEAGGNMNGTTNRDRTNYFETVPSNYLETALWLEADRMGYLLKAVTQEKFEVQRSTVKNEKSQRVENVPYGLVGERMGQILYPQGHPYSWSVIGYVDDLDRADVEDLKKFFLRWYGPNNATLVIGGDFEKSEALKLVQKYYGSIPRGPEVRPARVERNTLPIDRYAQFNDDVVFPRTDMVFPTVQAYHPDEPALDFLAYQIGGGSNSFMHQDLIKTEKAVGAGSYHSTSELSGEFTLVSLAYPNLDVKENEENMRAALAKFEKEGVNLELLKAFKATNRAQALDYTESVASKASLLSYWSYMLPNRPYNMNDEVERYEKITEADVIRVYNRYIKGKSAAIVNVIPYPPGEKPKEDENRSNNPNANLQLKADPAYDNLVMREAPKDFDRSMHPKPAQSKLVNVPEFYRAKLNNGIDLIGTYQQEVPKVAMLFTVRGAHLLEDEKSFQLGTASLLADMLNEGTKNFTTEELDLKLAKLGSSISFNGGSQSFSILVESETEKLDETLKILEEKLMNPGFREDDFKRVKKQTQQGLNQTMKQPSYLASITYNQLIFGDSPLGKPSAGTPKSLEKIKLKDLQDFYTQFFSPQMTDVVVVGNITEADAKGKLSFLDKWKGERVELPVLTSAPNYGSQEPKIYLVDKMNAAQTEIRVGNIGMPYDATGDFFKSTVMNFPLGGSFNSRINLNLREDKGFTYGARSFFTASEYPGTFTVSTAVRRSATDSAIKEIMKEIKEYKEKGATQEELDFARSNIISSEALNYETLYDKAGFLGQIVRYDLPKDFKKKQLEVLNSMSVADVNAIAKQRLNPDQMVILVVGDSFRIKDRLEKELKMKVEEISPEKKIKTPSPMNLQN